MINTVSYQITNGWVELVHGTAFYFDAPTDKMIRVEEIAHSLARICRYNGHTIRHYSVAEHTILLADYVEKNGGSPRECLTALHHDNPEYIVGDMTSPLKVTLPDFKKREAVLGHVLSQKFRTIWPLPAWLKKLDTRICLDERRAVMNPSGNDWGIDGMEPLDVRLKWLTGRSAMLMKRAWLKRHYRWTAMMNEGAWNGI